MMTMLRKKVIKFIYSEKATKFCEISTLLLSYVVPVKRKVKILQNFEAFINFIDIRKLQEKVKNILLNKIVLTFYCLNKLF